MHPTSRPIMTAHDFMMGDPNLSHKMIIRNTSNPRTMNCALPQAAAFGALLLGQSWKSPVSGRVEQVPEPPAQLLKPDWIRLIPINMTVGPVTRGGKIFLSILAGAN